MAVEYATRREAAKYIAELALALSRIAQRVQLSDLAYLLEMAACEATNAACGGRNSAARRLKEGRRAT